MCVCEKSPYALLKLPKSFGSLACKSLCTRCLKIHAFLSSHEFIYCSIVYTYFCLLLFKCYYMANATQNNMSFNAIQIPPIISLCAFICSQASFWQLSLQLVFFIFSVKRVILLMLKPPCNFHLYCQTAFHWLHGNLLWTVRNLSLCCCTVTVPLMKLIL